MKINVGVGAVPIKFTDNMYTYATVNHYGTYIKVPMERINELEETKMDYICSQETAIEAIKDGYFIVGSLSPITHSISFSARPRLHATETSARAECKRLARDSSGTMYVFVKFSGAEMIPNSNISI